MTRIVPVSEAKAKLTALVHDAENEDVVLVRHGRPAAVLVSSQRYDALLELLDEQEDRLSVYERENLTIGIDTLKAELGLNDE